MKVNTMFIDFMKSSHSPFTRLFVAILCGLFQWFHCSAMQNMFSPNIRKELQENSTSFSSELLKFKNFCISFTFLICTLRRIRIITDISVQICVLIEIERKVQWTHQMKSLQWLQNVGCLKNRGMKRWSLTLYTFFFFSAPLRPRFLSANLLSGSFSW